MLKPGIAQEDNMSTVTTKTEPKKAVVIKPSSTPTALLRTAQVVLNSEHLNPANREYIQRIHDKCAAGKFPTENETQGLLKIEQGVIETSKAVAKERLESAKKIGS
jgi:hypothetical protein